MTERITIPHCFCDAQPPASLPELCARMRLDPAPARAPTKGNLRFDHPERILPPVGAERSAALLASKRGIASGPSRKAVPAPPDPSRSVPGMRHDRAHGSSARERGHPAPRNQSLGADLPVIHVPAGRRREYTEKTVWGPDKCMGGRAFRERA